MRGITPGMQVDCGLQEYDVVYDNGYILRTEKLQVVAAFVQIFLIGITGKGDGVIALG